METPEENLERARPSSSHPYHRSEACGGASPEIEFTFDGNSDPWVFAESMEEMYGMKFDNLVAVLSEVLTGRAVVWYRNNRLKDEICRRHQKPRERFKDYMLAMQDLLRHSGYTDEQKIERIFKNALPEFLTY